MVSPLINAKYDDGKEYEFKSDSFTRLDLGVSAGLLYFDKRKNGFEAKVGYNSLPFSTGFESPLSSKVSYYFFTFGIFI